MSRQSLFDSLPNLKMFSWVIEILRCGPDSPINRFDWSDQWKVRAVRMCGLLTSLTGLHCGRRPFSPTRRQNEVQGVSLHLKEDYCLPSHTKQKKAGYSINRIHKNKSLCSTFYASWPPIRKIERLRKWGERVVWEHHIRKKDQGMVQCSAAWKILPCW